MMAVVGAISTPDAIEAGKQQDCVVGPSVGGERDEVSGELDDDPVSELAFEPIECATDDELEFELESATGNGLECAPDKFEKNRDVCFDGSVGSPSVRSSMIASSSSSRAITRLGTCARPSSKNACASSIAVRRA
jgi:hypothetical protein